MSGQDDYVLTHCFLCGHERIFRIGLFVPDVPALYGRSHFHYGLCRRCWRRRPRIETALAVERKILAGEADA